MRKTEYLYEEQNEHTKIGNDELEYTEKKHENGIITSSNPENNTSPENQNKDVFLHDLKIGISLTEEERQKQIKLLQTIIDDPTLPGAIEKFEKRRAEQERIANENPMFGRYEELYDSLPVDQQQYMKDNLKITDDGKVEVIAMKKKFGLLIAKTNRLVKLLFIDNPTIFDGSHVDRYGRTGIPGVTYFTGKEAEKQAKKQKKCLLKDKAEVLNFISHFPGVDEKEKIFNFLKLLGLENVGCRDALNKKWDSVGTSCCVMLSEVDKNDHIFGTLYDANIDILSWYAQRYPIPAVVRESC